MGAVHAWVHVHTVSLNKRKGDKYECSNSSGFSLLSVDGKLYGKMLIKSVMDVTECATGVGQCGLRQGRGCMCQVRQLCEMKLADGKGVFWAFTVLSEY